MADVKWIKLNIDMFDNRKIKYLRRLPDGNSVVLIWVMLLTMAGRCNASGMIFLTENIPYTSKALADELGFEESLITMALTALENLDMICSDNKMLAIPGWEEYQSADKLEKIREQTRERVAKHRENLKKIECNVTCNASVTQCNATEEELELDKELDKDIKDNRAKSTRFVPPTHEEVENYCLERNNKVDAERFIDFYSSKGWMVGKNKMKDWKACIRTWERSNSTSTQNTQKQVKKSALEMVLENIKESK